MKGPFGIIVIMVLSGHLFAQENQLPPWLLQPEKVAKRIEKVSPKVGELAPDFTQKDSIGTAYKLYSFKGKYVLLDFWASWCPPCRAEHPNLVKAYNKYKDKNFTIIGITRDEEKERYKWLRVVKEDGLTWLQLSDFDQSTARLYNAVSLPTNFLIDPERKIIAVNLRGERLERVLEEVLEGEKQIKP